MANRPTKQQLILVTGKGGVGKSVVAAAIARKEALQGSRVLLVELGDESSYQYIFQKPVGFEPVSVEGGFDVAIWSGEACLRQYIRHFVKIEKVVDLFFDNRVMRTFIKAAPALRELAILGKLTSKVRQWGPPLEYDVVVLDGYASGHFLALLRAPLGMADLVQMGPMGDQSRSIHEVITNPDICRMVVVTLPEELPTAESLNLHLNLQWEFQQRAQVLGNRWLKIDIKSDELMALKSEIIASPNSQEAMDFINYLQVKLERQQDSEEQLSALGGQFQSLPHVFLSDPRQIIKSLSDELEPIWSS